MWVAVAARTATVRVGPRRLRDAPASPTRRLRYTFSLPAPARRVVDATSGTGDAPGRAGADHRAAAPVVTSGASRGVVERARRHPVAARAGPRDRFTPDRAKAVRARGPEMANP
ncbi:hypothetical protein GCM10023175_46140 [Pseudonocardia xishanensis]|uniref:Uncharacterized protein n=1 Tax=Pseudonocardia xishanensis TaxID=630995 RepID=A0ABP8RXK0_9PSEU